MKLNNKGFAISGVLYSLLILFVTLFIGILTILATTKFSLDKVKNDITDKLETLTYRDTILNGADPIIKTGMIPVTIDLDGTVKKADVTSAWYDYDKKMWANAVTVTETNRGIYENANAGTIIAENDILTYLVWIPRYKYRLWYVGASDGDNGYIDETKVHSIDIVFESKNSVKSNGNQNGQYLTHPAFTFGEEELNGIWVGKFETGYNGATNAIESEISIADSTKVIIKPNMYSWRGMNVSNAFYTALGMTIDDNIFGLSTDTDAHMMKNTEWGAVTYLSHSKYGIDKDMYKNNNSNFITGCGADSANEDENETCKNSYGTRLDNLYNQSSTGNITGIYDMSGLANEYVMGYTTGATTEYGASGFTSETFPEDKYVDTYVSTVYTQYSKKIFGDATGELGPFTNIEGSWYGDYAKFIDSTYPWFIRGGHFDVTYYGTFAFSSFTGESDSVAAFRIVFA